MRKPISFDIRVSNYTRPKHITFMWGLYPKGRGKGVALILVISVLAVATVMAVSFTFTMRLEAKAASNYLYGTHAAYIAEGGIAHAKAVLKLDKLTSQVDHLGETWATLFTGLDSDNDSDGKKDSRWINFRDIYGKIIGRYAVLITDESSKININTAGYHNESPLKVTQGWAPFEVSLKDFFNASGIVEADNLSQKVLDYRFGQDRRPSSASLDDDKDSLILSRDGIDNDADGIIDEGDEGIDEPDEFNPILPVGDDKPFFSIEEFKDLMITTDDYNKIRNLVTIYSADREIDMFNRQRKNINEIKAFALLDILIERGVENPWQKAVNMVDFADEDFILSTIPKISKSISVSNEGPKGGWVYKDGYYECSVPGSLAGTWTFKGLPDGEYYLIVYGGAKGQLIGDVTVGEWTQGNMFYGETFTASPNKRVQIKDGALVISIQNNSQGTSYFKYVELIPNQTTPTGFTVSEVRGIEAIRINELMVKPAYKQVTSISQNPGGDWLWQNDHYENSKPNGGKEGQGVWKWTDIPDGKYYLKVYAGQTGQIVGDVEADGVTQKNMESGQLFTARDAISITGGILKISIQNNTASSTCYFKYLELSQAPDGEYIELINLSDKEVDLGGWTMEGTGSAGWPATIPLGTKVGPLGVIVLAVDKNDSYPGVSGNGISFYEIWGSLFPVAQLNFSKSIQKGLDILRDDPIPNEDNIILKDPSGNAVDKVEYFTSSVSYYRSLERGDPASIQDLNSNGFDEGWFYSNSLLGATPGTENDNSGLVELLQKGGVLEQIKHSQKERGIANHPCANIANLIDVPTGEAWRKFTTDDISKIVDVLTVHSLRLEAEGHSINPAGWSERLQPAPKTSWFESQSVGGEGIWSWDVENGLYTLSVYGKEMEAISVAIGLADGSFTSFSPPLNPDEKNRIEYGIIEIGNRLLKIKIKNSSQTETAHFDYCILQPLNYIRGKLNINTASKEVLLALPGMDVQRVDEAILNRPYGNKNTKMLGIGDLLPAREDIFNKISNLITTRSNVYRVISTGQSLSNGVVVGEKRIETVIER